MELNNKLKNLNTELNSKIQKINYQKLRQKKIIQEKNNLLQKEFKLQRENLKLEKERVIQSKNLESLINDYNSINNRYFIVSDLQYLSKLRETKNFVDSQINEWKTKVKDTKMKVRINDIQYIKSSKRIEEDLFLNVNIEDLDFKIKYYEERLSDLKISILPY